MLKRSILLLVGLAIFTAAAIAQAAHPHHATPQLSPGYRSILRAFLDPHATITDQREYIHAARLAIKTKKDEETQLQMDQFFDHVGTALACSDAKEDQSKEEALKDRTVRDAIAAYDEVPDSIMELEQEMWDKIHKDEAAAAACDDPEFVESFSSLLDSLQKAAQ